MPRTSSSRLQLPLGCSCSKPAVYPTNWNAENVSVKKDWYIHYRFYDPMITEGKYKNGKLVPVKGMNESKDREERQRVTELLLENEEQMLRGGYNPITKKTTAPDFSAVDDIDNDTLIIPALRYAFTMLRCSEKQKYNIKRALVHIEKAIADLWYHVYPVSTFQRRHVRQILKKVGINKGGWTAPNFNHYRTWFMSLFAPLQEVEVAQIDFTMIKKMIETKRIRPTLSKYQVINIDRILRRKHYRFWRFINIFFQSGARIAEIMRVKKEDVDLEQQTFKIIVYKRKKYEEVRKSITNSMLPLWTELMDEANVGDYIFSKHLNPGPVKINEKQITRRWYLRVKKSKDPEIKALNITADFYAFKHLFTTAVVEKVLKNLNEANRQAAIHNDHKDSAMVIDIYNTNQKELEHEEMKKINIQIG